VVKLEASYKRPARYDDVVQLRTTLARVGAVKVEHTYELWRGEDLLVTGSTTLACLDREGRARAMPEGFLTA
jgi:acyl-CoA thioester hydrolase